MISSDTEDHLSYSTSFQI